MFTKTHNMLGLFILPLFISSLFLGLVGLGIFFYLLSSNLTSAFFLSKFVSASGTSILAVNQIYLTPTVLNLLGAALFVAGMVYTKTGMKIIKPKGKIKKLSPFLLLSYLLIYLAVYPLILVSAIYRITVKKIEW